MNLKLKIYPNRQKSEILPGKTRDDIDMAIALRAKAEDNEANIELIRFLAKHFKIEKSAVEIVRGLKSRVKKVRITIDI